MSLAAASAEPETGPTRYRDLPPFWQGAIALAGTLSVLMVAYKAFGWGLLVGYIPIEEYYMYALFGLLVPFAFILFPLAPSAAGRVPWYDVVLFLAFLAGTTLLTVQTRIIIDFGWEFAAPSWAKWLALGLWLLVLEATRRAAGMAVAAIIAVGSFYPVVGDVAFLGPFQIASTPILDAAAYHLFGGESVTGIPIRAMVNIVLGFLLFGVALQHTGAGAFFLNLSFALLGSARGGPAKVAIVASGLTGSISGSVVTNVVTTGAMTIPTMRKIGLPPAKAGAVEACASTGGVLMPPVMGATAFIMATYLEIPYQTIALAAAIPSFLYFFGLFMQIDAFAVRQGLKGLPRKDLPRLGAVLREGWYYLFVLVVLVWLLFYLKQDSLAPFYATATLLIINQILPHHRWNLRQFFDFLYGAGKLFVEIGAILAGVSLLMGALILTGKIGALAYDIIGLAGSSVLALLVMGALVSMILGMGMTITAAYLFLAIALGPALAEAGLETLPVHLFMMYWAMISYITPPVAFAAFAAAPLAGATPMRTGLEAMRLGTVIYFIPFFFVLNPALLGFGTALEVMLVVATAVVGVALLAGALQGYLIGVGPLAGLGPGPLLARALLFAGGLLFMMPGGERTGLSPPVLLVAAVAMTGAAVAIAKLTARPATPPVGAEP